MIDLSIDTSSLSAEFSLTQGEVDGLLQYTVEEIAAQFAKKWDTEAKSLGKTRDQYRAAIQVSKVSRFSTVVYLNPAAQLPNMIEMGASAFDMKIGFLKSTKVKYDSKGSPYLTIPFRFATPGADGFSSAFAGVMPQVIYAAVKNEEKVNPTSKSGLPLSKIPEQFQIPKTVSFRQQIRSGNFSSIPADAEMTSIYQGVQRNAKGSGYVMFRRVSVNTDADRWQHPGFDAKNLADKALAALNVPQEVDIATDNYLSKLGF